jgi:hypothetical protein
MKRFALFGVVIAGAAAAVSMGFGAPADAGTTAAGHASVTAATVYPAPSGNYSLSVYFNGEVTPFTMTVIPGACTSVGCVGTWTPNVGGLFGTYTWSSSNGAVAFVLGQDHFYGKVTATGINSASGMGRLVVKCPLQGTKYGTWYANSIGGS